MAITETKGKIAGFQAPLKTGYGGFHKVTNTRSGSSALPFDDFLKQGDHALIITSQAAFALPCQMAAI
jgi:hypothetical protein